MPRSLTAADVRAALRAAACQVAATIPAQPRVTGPTAESCFTGVGAVIVEFRPGDSPNPFKTPSISPAVAAEFRRQSRLETDVLRTCSHDVPLKGLVIARRIGRAYDSYLRGTLARLVREGKLRRASNGNGYLLGN